MESGRGLSPAVDNQATPGLSTAANRAAKTLRPEGMESRASMNQLNDRGKGFEVLLSKGRDARRSGAIAQNCHPRQRANRRSGKTAPR
jgi:hypothetical protein